MKSAIFINEDRTQIVLTPENEWEQTALKMMSANGVKPAMYFAQFTDVQGGWTKFESAGYRGKEKDSLIMVLDKAGENL